MKNSKEDLKQKVATHPKPSNTLSHKKLLRENQQLKEQLGITIINKKQDKMSYHQMAKWNLLKRKIISIATNTKNCMKNLT